MEGNPSRSDQVKQERVIIDTDGGVDDAIAILLALNSPKELFIEAITTVAGNVPLNQATENVMRVLELNQKYKGTKDLPPVFKGETKPLQRNLITATNVHGEDGLGGATKKMNPNNSLEYLYPHPTIECNNQISAIDAILEIVSKNPGQIKIITLGPLTNLAVCAKKDKEKFKCAKEIIIMGGSFETYGNITLSAEYNIYVDPEALHEVLQAGVPVTFVPLDVTMKVWFNQSLLEPFIPTSPLAFFISQIISFVIDFKSGIGEPGMHVHDPLTVAAAMDQSCINVIPEHFRKSTFVQVECLGQWTSGKTIAELRPERLQGLKSFNAKVCCNVNPEKFFDLFKERVLKGPA